MNARSSDDASYSTSRWRERGLFFRSWLRAPGLTGSAIPSSRVVSRDMAKVIDGYQTPVVAELGPGTGPITAAIQDRLSAEATHVAVELNDSMAMHLAEAFPRVDVVNESATELPRILKDREIDRVNVVLSGLPFTSFPDEVQAEILDGVTEVMTDDGIFATVRLIGAGMLPPAKRFQAELDRRFGSVQLSRLILRNLPPLYIMLARQPRRNG